MKNSSVIITILCASLLPGCALKPLPAIDIYTVSPSWHETSIQAESAVQIKKQRAITLKLAPIQGVRSFSATDIIYSDVLHGRNKYAYSRWSDSPVRLLQTYIQVALEQSKQFLAVVPSTSVSNSDYLLESVLLDFSQHFKEENDSEAVIRMHFYLINSRSKKMIAGKEFITRVPTSSNDAAGAALALNQGASIIVQNLVSWVAEQRLQ